MSIVWNRNSFLTPENLDIWQKFKRQLSIVAKFGRQWIQVLLKVVIEVYLKKMQINNIAKSFENYKHNNLKSIRYVPHKTYTGFILNIIECKKNFHKLAQFQKLLLTLVRCDNP